ncbi:hypothetical protein [Hyalangium rubrum]|uniref:Flp family type IVb pilin n=1 Tax=Hyalangium rubrum TaxID=3103134 RepID=A0ABU5HGN0_9BACT|nr:hypothetical protein [Hyalangium sp. s54d21]MDY7231250.1 hypothetical protein [Hyalangium sp. s54d21]
MSTKATQLQQGAPRRERRQRGQAMVEYSAITFFLATSGGVAIVTVLPMLMNALDQYLQGIYFMLNMAIP